jgi:hypothetical protein
MDTVDLLLSMTPEDNSNNEKSRCNSPSEKDLRDIAMDLIEKYNYDPEGMCQVSTFVVRNDYLKLMQIQSNIKKSHAEDLNFESTDDSTTFNLKEADFQQISNIINEYLHPKN